MNDVQNLIDRQLGIYCQLNYDNVLKRLVVDSEESFYGLQSANVVPSFDHDPPIFACRFSEAPGFEHILALANEDGRVAIQNTTSKNTARTLDGFECHNNAVFDLAWMPGHMRFVTVSGDHTACLWDVGQEEPRKVLVFANHTRSVKTAAFRPTEPSVFASGGRDGHILVWDIRASANPPLVLKPDHCLVNCHARFTPKSHPGAPGSHGKRPRLDPHRAVSITGLVFQDDLTLISCGECDGNIKVWDLRRCYNIYNKEPLPRHSIPYCGSSTRNGYTNLIIDDARVRLYASCMDNVIYCFNVATYNTLPERRYVGHESGTFYIKASLSPDCAYLVSGSSDRSAYLWSVRASQPLVRLVGHRAEVTCAAWARGPTHAHTLVTCSDDARHKLWRLGPQLDHPDHDPAPAGRAEPLPRADTLPPAPWGSRDRTPGSLKRRATTPTPATPATPPKRPRARPSTKRCLADSMGAAREHPPDAGAKRARLAALPSVPEEEVRLLSAGAKRPAEDGPASADWSYIPRAGGFMTPTKNYESGGCRMISPRGLRPLSPGSVPCGRSPERVSPGKVRIVSFTPTKNLPNYVLDGEAPHLRLMSPVKKKQDTTDWLTLIVRERRGKGGRCPEVGDGAPAPALAPLSPKENVPPRRNSTTDRTPKSNKKSRTLLKYFSIASKEK